MGLKTISSTNNHEDCFSLQDSEPVASFVEKLPLIVSKNLQENTCAGVFFNKVARLAILKIDSGTRAFL